MTRDGVTLIPSNVASRSSAMTPCAMVQPSGACMTTGVPAGVDEETLSGSLMVVRVV